MKTRIVYIKLMIKRFEDLPIRAERKNIVSLVDSHQVTIITAETGAGKSTQVPQYLAEHGYDRVIVTQPRILAARNLSKRVREEWAKRNNEDSTDIIGYRTAHERDDSGKTSVLYCTDGLQLVRELTGIGTRDRQVLILDEVHEWNENMEVLIAWAKLRCQEEPNFKVVIMSATIETEGLKQFFGDAAVLHVKGRHYPVSRRRGSSIIPESVDYMKKMKNTLVFLPGKQEIQDTLETLTAIKDKEGYQTEILPLHSQLTVEDQQRVFGNYPGGKIILATNIAQTSITIDDIDIVLDSGLERRSEVRDGVEGLFIGQISQADISQRAGRAGRTKKGEYVLAPYETMPCLPEDKRDEYPVPEIMRKHIDRLTLRLAAIDIDIESLDFYHDPSRKAIKQAKRTLQLLGALSEEGKVTDIGHRMERFPVESSFGRMLIACEDYGDRLKAKLAVIIAIQEVGGIVRGGSQYNGWRSLTRQNVSDLLAQYEVYIHLDRLLPHEYEETGIIEKNIKKASEVIERLCRDLGVEEPDYSELSEDDVEQLLKSIVAGSMHQLWYEDSDGMMQHIYTKQVRERSSSSVVKHAKLVSGTPFDLQIPTRSGGLETLHLIQGLSVVKGEWLNEIDSDQFMIMPAKYSYNPRLGMLTSSRSIRTGKRMLQTEGQPVVERSRENYKLFKESLVNWIYSQLEAERRNLERYYGQRIPSIPSRQINYDIQHLVGDVISLDELDKQTKRQVMEMSKLDSHLGERYLRSLSRNSHSKRQPRKRGSWQPRHKRGHR